MQLFFEKFLNKSFLNGNYLREEGLNMLISRLLDILFPPKCSFCKTIIKHNKYCLCNECLKDIRFIKNGCDICGKSKPTGYKEICPNCIVTKHFFDKCVSVFEYRSQVKSAIIRYKFFGKREIAKTFAKMLEDKISRFEDIDYITSVPLHAAKLRIRGFNQCDLIARILSKDLDLKFDNKILIKTKDTKSQSLLNRGNRLKNLKNAFEILDTSKIANKNILLIDDIYTTGATVSECAKCLKQGGANKVFVLTLASGKGY